MKRLFLVFSMIACIFSMTACGSKAADVTANPEVDDAAAVQYAEQMISQINAIVSGNMEDQVLGGDDTERQAQMNEVLASAFDSWRSASEDMGSFQRVVGEPEVTRDADSTTIRVEVEGSKRNANVVLVLDDEMWISSITTNVKYTFGEMMEKAALNTLLGMGTVFSVLILISLLISCFVFIPKMQEKFTKKEAKQEIREVAVENAVAQIVEAEEELSDDLELVAVIAAAVAASEGAASTDGFVVRSIKRANTNKWQRA